MFYKKVNKNNCKDMYNFIKNHFTYYTMNSWNGLYSIANNVKVYNLDIKGNEWKLLEILQLDNYGTINYLIEDWEQKHKGYTVGFNGRSDGYLVLGNKENNKHIFDNYQQDFVLDADNYEEFKKLLHNADCTLKQYKSELVKMVELVQDFDKLCDDLVSECQYMLDNYDIEEEQTMKIDFDNARDKLTNEFENGYLRRY